MYYVRFGERIKDELINHTLKNPNLECGGFLYGNILYDSNDIYYDVDAIYHENYVGSDKDFRFNFIYICHGYDVAKELFLPLIGTYHSHGLYDADLSDVDRHELQKRFGEDKITIVYSPKYNNMVGEFLGKDGKSHKVKFL